jgi:hypothetical protein
MMAYRYAKIKKGEFSVLIGKPSPEEEREFYRITSGGFVSYYRGSSPNLGAPRSPSPEGQPQPAPAKATFPRSRAAQSPLEAKWCGATRLVR